MNITNPLPEPLTPVVWSLSRVSSLEDHAARDRSLLCRLQGGQAAGCAYGRGCDASWSRSLGRAATIVGLVGHRGFRGYLSRHWRGPKDDQGRD